MDPLNWRGPRGQTGSTENEMDFEKLAGQLVRDFGFPPESVHRVGEALIFAAALLRLDVNRPRIKDRLRELKQERKRNPDDMDLWEEEFRLRAGQQAVIVDMNTKVVTVEKRRDHVRGKQPNRNEAAALAVLADVWREFEMTYSRYVGSPMLRFLSHSMSQIGGPTVDEDAIRHRLKS